ncbi:Rieske 2Fe-2S domain-containing protein [Nocardia sp. NBC_01388]|uniref:Rieske 2Fe-2S domain-containing protein n=1 Tax=Nocardia sp. NBC_01388 TaxID=2903596 RepID=UPI003248FB6E
MTGGSNFVPHWQPNGWFQVGWSSAFPEAEVRPLRYFGRDLVAFRTEVGDLRILDAYCRHLGGHLGYGGKVEGDCIVCPFHGWQWDSEGRNRHIPYQPDRPNRGRRIRAWDVRETNGIVYLWHSIDGSTPSWEPPDIFAAVSAHTASLRYHEPSPEAKVSYGELTLHPQLVIENAADPMHFRQVHGTRDYPVFLRRWEDDWHWFSQIGFGKRWREMDPDSHNGDTLSILNAGVGMSYTALSGSDNTLILLSTTPTGDRRSELFQTVWLEELPGDDEPGVLEKRLARAVAQLPNDIEIWQHQRFENPPALASREGKEFVSLRKWARAFYVANESAEPLASAAQG